MSRQIKKLLIANRGEIALRIMRTCKEMGIKTVAVYSEADKNAPHVFHADEAYLIGHPPAKASYLDISKIIEVAKKSTSDAIHPGYGFLSENSDFVEAVTREGIIFVGPSVESMNLLGDKTAARKLAQSAGVPIAPGTVESVVDVNEAKHIASEIGYPILLKAAGGGGGKGMRVVRAESELSSQLNQAKGEAASAFDDPRIFIEKYIENPRHVEVQILADSHGNVIHLGERECSIQRRHQKIVEESPSPVVDETLRNKITTAAISLIKKAEYINAATVEFLLDSKGKFYFLEVNTRLQVEHPVTEARTGIDIVAEQIRIAEGKKLPFSQQEITFQGNSIECRVYAEDPKNDFFPCTGTIQWLSSGQGIGVREDRGVEIGSEITPYYDPLISKVTVWGNTRNEALNRMLRVLYEYEIFGIETNLSFCLWLMKNKEFREGNFDTHFIEKHFKKEEITVIPDDLKEIAAIVTAAYVQKHDTNGSAKLILKNEISNWKLNRKELLR
ncbi:MAG: acetyl-CoA carboxylase biotin carboxylase subunit [Bacteroidetes bacterium]|nr:MAG: acetyl-CoA carboxylase biotin carboxylase subunit [Bacteroidota bacterium]